MNLALLKSFCVYIKNTKRIISFKRKEANLFVFIGEDIHGVKNRFYMNMARSLSTIFVSDEEIVGRESFYAPFDIKLAQCTTNSYIEEVRVDGDNRILQFFLMQKEQYKIQYFWLICEFTGKHTNVILCDKDFIVLEALRHISLHKSWREVRVGEVLKPLPQPLKTPISTHIPQDIYPLLKRAYEDSYKQIQESKKQHILQTFKKKQKVLLQALYNLPKQPQLIETADSYAHYGSLIFNSLYLLPSHKVTHSYIILKDMNGQDIKVPLPAHVRDLQEAGNWYFAQSKKYRRKAQFLDKQVQNLQDKIQFIDNQIACIERFSDFNEIFIPHKKVKSVDTGAAESFFIEGFKVSIGRNARNNQKLLENAKANDIWLHIRDVPSPHVIIHCGKQTPALYVLEKVGKLLISLYVVHKGSGDFVVDWTRRKFVKLSAHAQVVYSKHKSIRYRI